MPEDVQQDSVQIPEDFAAYETWRQSGELPKSEDEVEAPAAKAEDQPEPETDPDPEPATTQEEEDVPAGVQKRINKAVAKQKDAERRLAEIEQRLAQIQGSRPVQETAQPAKADTGKPVPPDPANWTGNWEELETAKLAYIEKLTDWKADQRDQAREKKEADNKAAELQKQANIMWKTRVAAVTAKHRDFDDVMAAADVPILPAMRDAIVTSEHGPEVLYFLAKNPAETERIAALAPVAAVREIGKLEARLSTTPEKPRPAASKAPPPPKTLSGAAKASTPDIYDEKFGDDFNAWEKVRKAQLKRR